MYYACQKGNMKLYVGVVEGEPQRWERDGKVAMIVTLKDYQGERIKIFFRNDEAGSPKVKMLADRVVNAKVHDGIFMTALATCSDPEEKTATGLDFKYRGRWTFTGDDGLVTTVLAGYATRPRKRKEGMFSFTIPVDEVRNGESYTMWCDVTFFDADRNGNDTGRAKKAEMLVDPPKYGNKDDSEKKNNPFVVVTGGAVKESLFNDKPTYSMIGWSITKRP